LEYPEWVFKFFFCKFIMEIFSVDTLN
jgi:hypothetical protein